ncbi:pentapeptide repeat-containing protein [Amycolatopsis sp. NPDC058278]|uniref:pentapeptide repeat-containing protein n=1 Tax=Amycolatopsis sp. NPDC058278 TaxID=3346417 RepID=UPI0036DA8806
MAPNSDSTPRPFSWWWLGIALPSSAIGGFVVAAILWGSTRAEHRDAFDTGWKSAAAILAVLAAVVAVERLRLGQREHYRQLAADRAKEINELSAKSSEQLGSDKAAVRIGGLTDLERLAQAHPSLQQTVVDRICAYLREPYIPPPLKIDPEDRRHLEDMYGYSEEEATVTEANDDDELIASRRLELDVRRTAQGILRRHLAPYDRSSYWPGITLDLRDASLVEFDLTECEVSEVNFEGATFYRPTVFSRVKFQGQVNFERVKFMSRARFDEAEFRGFANFAITKFFERVSFEGVDFQAELHIHLSHFRRFTSFRGVKFAQKALFMNDEFRGAVTFRESTFVELPSFEEAAFQRTAIFSGATFNKGANFQDSEFTGAGKLDRVQFADLEIGSGEIINLNGASVVESRAKCTWPPGWIIKDGKLTFGEQE